MKISEILSKVDRLAPRDLSDTPEGFAARYDAKKRISQVENNPRKAIDDHMNSSRNMGELATVTLVGKT